MLGGDEVIYLRPADGQNPVALRVSDGRLVEVKNLAETLNRAVHAVGDSFVLTNLGDGKTGLRLFDPVHERNVWSMELRKDTVMTVLENDRMAILEPEAKPAGQPAGQPAVAVGAKFAVIDLASGRRQELVAVPPDDLKGRNEIYVVAVVEAGPDRISPVIPKDHVLPQHGLGIRPSDDRFVQEERLHMHKIPAVRAFVRANGVLMAIDLASGKQRWKQSVQGQNLMLERLAFSPYLVFSSRKSETKGRLSVWSLQLLVIDKQTGTKLLDEKSSAQPGFRSITISTVDRYVELRSYQERVRIYPVDKSAAAGQSGG